MSYVLWLTSWYPSRVQPTNGDFVERHAQCVSRLHPLVVLHIEKDERLSPGTSECVETTEGNCTVFRVYYGRSRWGALSEKLFSLYTYKKLQHAYFQKIVQKWGEPELIHVHESMKAGLLAMELKKTKRIPYVLTMHWTGYQTKFPPHYAEKGWYWNRLNKKILRQADTITVVSNDLGNSLQEYTGPLPIQTVHNVVDTTQFYPAKEPPSKFRFIHASYLNQQKNPVGIIQAAAALQRLGHSFELMLIGREDPALMELAIRKGMSPENILIPGSLAHHQMPEALRMSSALVMFSRFENMPCIILEALCTGLPVISTRVGGIAEVVNDSNGVLVDNEDESALMEAMKQVLEHYEEYDRKAIAQKAASFFNPDAVAQAMDTVYREVGKPLGNVK